MYTVDEYIEHLRSEVNNLSWKNNLNCIIIFGSLINIPSLTLNKDIDLCIVLNNRDENSILKLRTFINEHFIQPDITVYFLDELNGKLPFRDIGNGIFALEYFATGKTIFGTNIFIELLTKASKEEFKKSLLDKIFDYILRIRKKHILENTTEERTRHINKYLVRLIVDILVYFDYETLTNLQYSKATDIIQKAKDAKLLFYEGDISLNLNSDGIFKYEFLYELYVQVSMEIEPKLVK